MTMLEFVQLALAWLNEGAWHMALGEKLKGNGTCTTRQSSIVSATKQRLCVQCVLPLPPAMSSTPEPYQADCEGGTVASAHYSKPSKAHRKE